jgi:hypothetical protein
MNEIFPVLSGIALGLAADFVPLRFRALLICLFGLLAGAAASWISGELFITSFFLLIDIAQVLGAAFLARGIVVLWRRRAWRLL